MYKENLCEFWRSRIESQPYCQPRYKYSTDTQCVKEVGICLLVLKARNFYLWVFVFEIKNCNCFVWQILHLISKDNIWAIVFSSSVWLKKVIHYHKELIQIQFNFCLCTWYLCLCVEWVQAMTHIVEIRGQPKNLTI